MAIKSFSSRADEITSLMPFFNELANIGVIANATYNDDANPTAIICRDSNENIIFKIEYISTTNHSVTPYLYFDATNTISNNYSSYFIYNNTKSYTTSNGGLLQISTSNGNSILLFAHTNDGRTGISLFDYGSSTYNLHSVAFGDDIIYKENTFSLYYNQATNGSYSNLTSSTTFCTIPTVGKGILAEPSYLLNAYWIPFGQIIQGTFRKMIIGNDTYITNGYIALKD